jgi:hypothetical protein
MPAELSNQPWQAAAARGLRSTHLTDVAKLCPVMCWTRHYRLEGAIRDKLLDLLGFAISNDVPGAQSCFQLSAPLQPQPDPVMSYQRHEVVLNTNHASGACAVLANS